MRCFQKASPFFLAMLAFSGCTQPQDSKLFGLDTQKSNLEISLPYEIESVDILGNLHIPKGIIAELANEDTAFLEDLYRTVLKINKADGLSSLEGPQQEITLVVVIPGNFGPESAFGDEMRPDGEPLARFQELEKQWRVEFGIPGDQPLPALQTIHVPGSRSVWLQDVGEFAGIRLKDKTNAVPGFLDLQYVGPKIDMTVAKKIMEIFKLPSMVLSNYEADEPTADGNRGGNLEGTHENVPLVGNNMTPRMKAEIARLTKATPIEVKADWLMVGHVDEFLMFIPSADDCGGALVHADPLEALDLIRTKGSRVGGDIGWDSMKKGFEDLVKPGSRAKKKLEPSDYDFSRELPIGDDGQVEFGHWAIYKNVEAAKHIREGVAAIRSASRCLNKIVPIPMFFGMGPDVSEYDLDTPLSAWGGLANGISLRGHVVLPEITMTRFQDLARDRIGEVLGGADKVHFVNAQWYEMQYGSAHCATQVVREPGLKFVPPPLK